MVWSLGHKESDTTGQVNSDNKTEAYRGEMILMWLSLPTCLSL